MHLTHADVAAAADRIAGRVRPVAVARTTADDVLPGGAAGADVRLALELMQHTGSFKARGAQNFRQAHSEAGMLPEAGVTIASGGNAGLACVALTSGAEPAPEVRRIRTCAPASGGGSSRGPGPLEHPGVSGSSSLCRSSLFTVRADPP